MWLIKASLKNPYMVAALVFMILVLGVLAVVDIPKDILPVFKAPAVQVLTYFQGMPARSVEKTLTNRIERWVNQAPGVRKIESKSVVGASVVQIYFRDDIDPNSALTMTNQLAQGTLPTLPPNTLPPVTLPFDPTGTIPLGVLTVSNSDLDEAKIKDLARIDVRNMLGAVKGCVAPVVVGGKDRTILVYLRPKDLQARNLSPLDVVETLRKSNLMVTPGTAYFGNNQVLLDTNAMVKDVQEMMDFPIHAKSGESIYLRDIADVKDSYAIQTSRVRIDGHRQVYVPIYRQQGASSLEVANGVKDYIAYMEQRLPKGTKLEFVMDQSIYVKEAIRSLVEEGVIGACLVSVMILLFLGNWRMMLIASLSIPLAILGALVGLHVSGNTINAMTLGGLALAIGPLVDDAIVALENIHRHRHLGKSRVKAALEGSVEVMIPVLVATCTTCIVLAPLALMPGMGGFLFRPLALAVTFAMATSFLLSRTFVPMMCAQFLPDEHRRGAAANGRPHVAVEEHARAGWFGRGHRHVERFLNGLTRRYEGLLMLALRHRFVVLSMVGLAFLGSLVLLFGIGREFFPQVDAGQITIHVRAPSDLRLDAAERRLIDVEHFIEKHIPAKERQMVVSELGLDPDWSVAYTANAGQQDAVVRVQLTEHRSLTAQEYAVKLRQLFAHEPRFADLRFDFDTGGMVATALNTGAASPIDIEVQGGTTEQAFALARQIRERIAGVPGTADVHVKQRLDAPYLIIEVDRKKAADQGLRTENVIQQVVAAMNSSVSINRNFWIDLKTGNQYFVAVQYPESDNLTLEDVLNVPATGGDQRSVVTLGSLVNIRHDTQPVEINHFSLYRTFNVLVNTEHRDIAGVAADVQKRLQGLPVPEGMFVHMKGEYEKMNKSFKDLALGLGMAALLVYLLQVALFRSWVGPFIIMFTVPLGLIGVFTMLFLTRTTLNVQSMMGVIFLVGIAVNNGVLLVEFANQQRKLGAPVHKAIVTGAAIRFRPILMTFLATFLDLIPMAIGMGKGSEANVPLARAVVGGLLTSTCLTLFVVPIMYTLLMRDPLKPELDLDAELTDRPEAAPAPDGEALPATGAVPIVVANG